MNEKPKTTEPFGAVLFILVCMSSLFGCGALAKKGNDTGLVELKISKRTIHPSLICQKSNKRKDFYTNIDAVSRSFQDKGSKFQAIP